MTLLWEHDAAVSCLTVPQVDPERNLLYVRGQVPGPQGSFVLVRDAFRWKWPQRQAAELPFPTHIGDLPPMAVSKRDGIDPYRVSGMPVITDTPAVPFMTCHDRKAASSACSSVRLHHTS
jgi:hypothetical protein